MRDLPQLSAPQVTQSQTEVVSLKSEILIAIKNDSKEAGTDIRYHQQWQKQEQQSDTLVWCYVRTHLALWALQFAGAVTDGGKRLRLAFSASLKEIVCNSLHGLSSFQYQTFSLKKVSSLRAIHRLTSTLSRCRHSMVVNLSSFWKQTSFLCFPNFSN